MNSKIQKYITSGSKVGKVCQDLNEELKKAARNMSHQYIQKEATQVDRDTIKRITTPSADEQQGIVCLFAYLCDRFSFEFVCQVKDLCPRSNTYMLKI